MAALPTNPLPITGRYALIVSDPDRTVYLPKTEDGDLLPVSMVTLINVTQEKWEHSPVDAHIRGTGAEIHGRRRDMVVELFHMQGKPETPHLREQLTAQGYDVLAKEFPATKCEVYTVLAQRALVDFCLKNTRASIDYGVIAGHMDTNVLAVVYTAPYWLYNVTTSWQQHGVLPTVEQMKVRILGTIRNNHISFFAPEADLRPYFEIVGGPNLTWSFATGCSVPKLVQDLAMKKQAMLQLGETMKALAEERTQQLASIKKALSDGAKTKKQEYQARLKTKKRAAKKAESQENQIIDNAKLSEKHDVEGPTGDDDNDYNYDPSELVDIPDGRQLTLASVYQDAASFLSKHPDVCRSLSKQPYPQNMDGDEE